MNKIRKARLADIQVDEVSFVDKAANKRKFLFMKRDTTEGGDSLNLIKAFQNSKGAIQALEAIDKGFDDLAAAILTKSEEDGTEEDLKKFLQYKEEEVLKFQALVVAKMETIFGVSKAKGKDEDEDKDEDKDEDEDSDMMEEDQESDPMDIEQEEVAETEDAKGKKGKTKKTKKKSDEEDESEETEEVTEVTKSEDGEEELSDEEAAVASEIIKSIVETKGMLNG